MNLSIEETTELALKELRRLLFYIHKHLRKSIFRHCLQPDVNVWGLVTKLKDPQHFANFINSSEKHITNEEIAKHKYWISGKKSLQEENGLSKIVKSMFWSKPNHNEDLGHRFKCILCTDRMLGHRFNCHQCFLDP